MGKRGGEVGREDGRRVEVFSVDPGQGRYRLMEGDSREVLDIELVQLSPEEFRKSLAEFLFGGEKVGTLCRSRLDVGDLYGCVVAINFEVEGEGA